MSKFVPVVCPGCGAGCGLYLEAGDDGLVRSTPSPNDAVSGGRLCLRGWQMGDMVRNSLRLGSPMIWGKSVDWDRALKRAVRQLKPLIEERPERLGILAAGHLTNEDGYAISHFAHSVIGTGNVDNFGRSVDGPTIWGLQQATGQHYRRPPLSELVGYDVIVCLSSNIGDLNAQAGSWLARAQQVGSRLVVLDQLDDGLGRAADMYLEHAPGALGALLSALGDAVEADLHGVECPVDVTVLGDERFAEGFRRLVTLLGNTRRIGLVFSTRAFSTPHVGMVVGELVEKLNHIDGISSTAFAVNGTPNSVGLGHMGVIPTLGEHPEQDGFGLFEMLDTNQHNIDGLVVIGEELMSWLDEDGMSELRDRLEVLVVLDSFRTATSRIADVAFPCSGFGEHEGSFTTLDGKVRLVEAAIEPFRSSRHLPEVLADLAEALDRPAGPRTCGELWAEIGTRVPGYEGITLERLRAEGEIRVDLRRMPVHQDYAVEGPPDYAPIEVANPEEWGYMLMGRYDRHWWIYDGRMWSLPLLYREMRDWRAAHVMMNPDDMEREGVRQGRPLIVETARGRAEVVPWSHPALPAGLIVLPAHQRHLMDILMGPGKCDRRSCALAYNRTPARVRKG